MQVNILGSYFLPSDQGNRTNEMLLDTHPMYHACHAAAFQPRSAPFPPPYSHTCHCQVYGIAHLRLSQRLVTLCLRLLQQTARLWQESPTNTLAENHKALADSLLHLIGHISSEHGLIVSEEAYVPEFLTLIQLVPPLYSNKVDMAAVACSAPILVDQILDVLELVVDNQSVFQNLRTRLVGGILEKLDLVPSPPYKEGISDATPMPAIITPKALSHLLDLVREVYADARPRGECDGDGVNGAMTAENVGPTSVAEDLKRLRDRSEQLQALFPAEGQWLDQWMAAVMILNARAADHVAVLEAAKVSTGDARGAQSGGGGEEEEEEEEADAMFGDLFAELGRSEEEICASPRKKGSHSQSGAVDPGHGQVAQQILTFLETCMFCPEWDAGLAARAKLQLRTPHLNHMVALMLPSGGDGRCAVGAHSHRLLHVLMREGMVSDRMEVHLALTLGRVCLTPIASVGEASLLLLANLLVNRCVRRERAGDGPVDDKAVVGLWEDFFVTVNDVACSDRYPTLGKAFWKLPSSFHLQILFMGFYGLSEYGRDVIWIKALRALRAMTRTCVAAPPPSLLSFALSSSHLLLVLGQLASAFDHYPSWLPHALLERMSHSPEAIHFSDDLSAPQPVPRASGGHRGGRAIMMTWQQWLDELSLLPHMSVGEASSSSTREPLWGAVWDLVAVGESRQMGSLEEVVAERYSFHVRCHLYVRLRSGRMEEVPRGVAQLLCHLTLLTQVRKACRVAGPS